MIKLIPFNLSSEESGAVDFVNTLSKSLNEVKVMKPAGELPQYNLKEDFILWFASDKTKDDLIYEMEGLSENIRRKIIVADYQGEDPLGILEKTKISGLIPNKSIRVWLDRTPQRFLKLGEGHGLIGLKVVFNGSDFEDSFLDIQNSENYMIIYNYDIHDLAKILETYLLRLEGKLSSIG